MLSPAITPILAVALFRQEDAGIRCAAIGIDLLPVLPAPAGESIGVEVELDQS